MGEVFLILLFTGIVSGAFADTVVTSKGHPSGPWLAGGLFFGIFALIAAAGLQPTAEFQARRASEVDRIRRSPPPIEFVPSHRVPKGGLLARSGPERELEPLLRVASDTPVSVLATEGDWVQVMTHTGWEAWMDGRRLEPV